MKQSSAFTEGPLGCGGHIPEWQERALLAAMSMASVRLIAQTTLASNMRLAKLDMERAGAECTPNDHAEGGRAKWQVIVALFKDEFAQSVPSIGLP